MAQQFPDVLGIRTEDPMMGPLGLDPLVLTEQAMVDQAAHKTAGLAVSEVSTAGGKLHATVRIASQVGHKFPSGVGFRRAFVEFDVLDAWGNVLWASGRTDDAGLIVDERGEPIAGELWWKPDCSGLRYPDRLVFQPHYQTVTRQDQAQIYQELVTSPTGRHPECGREAKPAPPFTTSFLSICGHAKDNRLLPAGYLSLGERTEIAHALGAGEDLAVDAGAVGVGDDPDYVHGGGDALEYEVDLAGLAGAPASVKATLYYQATPPYFLQDRFCTGQGTDSERLYFLAGHLNLDDTPAASWKLALVSAAAAVGGGGAGM